MAKRDSTRNLSAHTMAIELGSNFHIKISRDIRSIVLSYRRFARLSPSQKEILKSYGKEVTHSIIGDLSLHFLKREHLSMRRSIRKSKRVIKRGLWDEFLTSLTISKGCPIPNLSEKDLKKQLEYRGFVPLEKYPKYNPDKYCYIMANRLIEGKEYIYPAKFTHNYKLMKKGIPDIHKEFALIAIMGYTRIQYSKIK